VYRNYCVLLERVPAVLARSEADHAAAVHDAEARVVVSERDYDKLEAQVEIARRRLAAAESDAQGHLVAMGVEVPANHEATLDAPAAELDATMARLHAASEKADKLSSSIAENHQAAGREVASRSSAERRAALRRQVFVHGASAVAAGTVAWLLSWLLLPEWLAPFWGAAAAWIVAWFRPIELLDYWRAPSSTPAVTEGSASERATVAADIIGVVLAPLTLGLMALAEPEPTFLALVAVAALWGLCCWRLRPLPSTPT
jgi:hypothetical protein